MRVRWPAGALGERRFRLLFAARAISGFGDAIAPIALSFAVLDETGSTADLGFVLAARQLASTLALLGGGVVADRISRDRIMLAANLVQGAAQAASAALILSDVARISELMALQAIYGLADGFFAPARAGITPQTVSTQNLARANALLQLISSVSWVVGPALGGLLVVVGSPGAALLVDAATFAVSAIFVAQLRLGVMPREASAGFFHELRAGWDEFRRRTWLWVMVTSFAVGNVFAEAPVGVLGPYIAKAHLGGAGAWGAIGAAGGIGAVAGGLSALRFRPRRPLIAEQLLWLLFPVEMVGLALLVPVPVLAVMSFLAGVGITISVSLWYTTLQSIVPEAAISRVSSYDELGSFVFYPLGFAIIGPVAAHVGVFPTLWVSAAISIAAILLSVATPAVRNIRISSASATPRPAG